MWSRDREMLRILIAEDEEPIANLIRINLTRAGYQCTWAPDGQTAADLMEREKFDLALLDIMLPGINGYELMDYAKDLAESNKEWRWGNAPLPWEGGCN